MKRLLLAITLIILSVSPVWGVCDVDHKSECYTGTATAGVDTLTVKTCYNDSVNGLHVQWTVDSATTGDTVNLPAGDCTWDTILTIPTAIRLMGAGSGTTSVTSDVGADYLIAFVPSDEANKTTLFRISGFTFDLISTSGAVKIIGSGTTPITSVMIDNNILSNCRGGLSGTSAPATLYVANGLVYGVIHSNTISGAPHFDLYARNATTWNNTTYSFGTANTLFIEDNTFNFTDATDTWALASHGLGGRATWRYNTVITPVGGYRPIPVWDNHGNGNVGGNYSTMGTEIYGNLVNVSETEHTAEPKLNDHRGGKGIRFYNLTTSATETPVTYILAREEYADTTLLTSYDCPAGGIYLYGETKTCNSAEQPQHVSDTYVWNNRYLTTLYHMAYDATGKEEDAGVLVEKTHFWNHNTSYNGTTETGIYCGTTLPAACTVGDGAWITTQACDSVPTTGVGKNPTIPISGTLYRCTATNTWTSYFTPYSYPHPLRGNRMSLGSGASMSLGSGAVMTLH